MPRRPKPKKKETRELENLDPLNKEEIEDIKKTVEIPVKEIRRGDIEKIEKVGIEKINPREKKSLKSLKSENIELIVTEKPQAAAKIAEALGDAKIVRSPLGVAYYELERKGKKIIVGCAVGHLFTLKQNASGKLPIFNISWAPNFEIKKTSFSKKYYNVLSQLAKKASEFTVATDYDTEGEVIGLNVIRFICKQHDCNRMKFSTLTSKELQEAYETKLSNLNWSQAIAGETRHYLDWFYGINLSRALMESIKSAGSFKIMSIGRVQGPTLKLIVDKEREIVAFKPQKYFQVYINIDKNNLELKYEKDIFKKDELEKFKDLVGKEVQVSTKRTEQKITPGVPFDLTTLQTEAYKFYGLTPAKTLQIAQSLYLAGLISYPRTSSQKLPISIAYNEILKKIAKRYNSEKFISRSKPIEGKKSDPAHPSIYPTGEFQDLEGDEKKICDLIVKRFIALFCSDVIIYNKKIEAEINNLKFNIRGMSIKEKGFLDVYPLKLQEKEILDTDGKAKITKIRNEEKETQPPRRYSPASIVSELEKRNLGTKATRANIIETLYDRGYIKERSIEATSLGMSLISTLEKYSPIIINENLTRQFEKETNEIINSKKDLEKKENKIINNAKQVISEIIDHFNKNNENIGKELIEANKELRKEEKKANEIMLCPICNKGKLAITYSKKNRKHFIACNAYPECKTTFNLPPYGLIKKTDKICQSCNWPLLMSIRKGKPPWIFCFNPNCLSRKNKVEYIKPQKDNKN